MGNRYSCTILVGGSVDRAAWLKFLTSFDRHGGPPLELRVGGQVGSYDDLSYFGITEIMTSAQESGVSIAIDADGDGDVGPAVYAWFPGMLSYDESTSVGGGEPALGANQLRQLLKDGKTIADALEMIAHFERAPDALLIDGKPPSDADLKVT